MFYNLIVTLLPGMFHIINYYYKGGFVWCGICEIFSCSFLITKNAYPLAIVNEEVNKKSY